MGDRDPQQIETTAKQIIDLIMTIDADVKNLHNIVERRGVFRKRTFSNLPKARNLVNFIVERMRAAEKLCEAIEGYDPVHEMYSSYLAIHVHVTHAESLLKHMNLQPPSVSQVLMNAKGIYERTNYMRKLCTAQLDSLARAEETRCFLEGLDEVQQPTI